MAAKFGASASRGLRYPQDYGVIKSVLNFMFISFVVGRNLSERAVSVLSKFHYDAAWLTSKSAEGVVCSEMS